MKVTVYLGSNMGDNPSFKEATIALGRWIAKNGLILVYGEIGRASCRERV